MATILRLARDWHAPSGAAIIPLGSWGIISRQVKGGTKHVPCGARSTRKRSLCLRERALIALPNRCRFCSSLRNCPSHPKCCDRQSGRCASRYSRQVRECFCAAGSACTAVVATGIAGSRGSRLHAQFRKRPRLTPKLRQRSGPPATTDGAPCTDAKGPDLTATACQQSGQLRTDPKRNPLESLVYVFGTVIAWASVGRRKMYSSHFTQPLGSKTHQRSSSVS